jgi:antitoxin (DNA-binding transcriptional repressor) of toxin-antitoxin stability system
MSTVTVHEAKTHLSRLIAKVLAGEEVIIARGKEPVVRLSAVNPPLKKNRVAGRLATEKTKGILDHGFFDPLPDDMLRLWNGEGD